MPTVPADLAPRRTLDPADGGVTTRPSPSPWQAQTRRRRRRKHPCMRWHKYGSMQAGTSVQRQAETKNRRAISLKGALTALVRRAFLPRPVASKDEEIRQLRQQLDALRRTQRRCRLLPPRSGCSSKWRQSRMEDESESRNQMAATAVRRRRKFR